MGFVGKEIQDRECWNEKVHSRQVSRLQDGKLQNLDIQELQVLLHDVHAEKMVLSQSFQVATIIEKLYPIWRAFKNYSSTNARKFGEIDSPLEDQIKQ